MSKYYRGVRVIEEGSDRPAPVDGTAGMQVVFGTAPVNLAADPVAAVNAPVLCRRSWDTARIMKSTRSVSPCTPVLKPLRYRR